MPPLLVLNFPGFDADASYAQVAVLVLLVLVVVAPVVVVASVVVVAPVVVVTPVVVVAPLDLDRVYVSHCE